MLQLQKIALLTLFLLLAGWHTACYAQQAFDFEKRQEHFSSTIKTLQHSPQALELRIWLRPYLKFDREELLDYNKKLIRNYTAEKKELNPAQKIAWLYEISVTQTNLDKTEQALQTLKEALELTNKKEQVWAYYMLQFGVAFIYRQTTQPAKANNVLAELLEIAQKEQHKDEEIHVKYWMAECHNNLGEFQEALKLCKELYSYSLEKDDFINASYNLIQVSKISALIETDTSYFEYYHSALELARKSEDQHSIAINLTETAWAYQNAGLHAEALQKYIVAEKHYEHLTLREQIHFLNGFSASLIDNKQVQRAKEFAQKALIEAQKVDGEFWTLSPLTNLAKVFQTEEKYDSAQTYLQQALVICDDLNAGQNKIGIYKSLSELYAKTNRFQEALAYLDSSHVAQANLMKESSSDKLAALRSENDYYIQKSQITELKNANEVSRSRFRYLLHVSTAIGLLLVISIYFFFHNRIQLRKLKDSHQNLVRKNLELDQLSRQLSQANQKNTRQTSSKKLKKSNLLLQHLQRLLNDEKIYTQPDLTLHGLANMLETNTTYLSALINTHYDCNFKTLINKQRIAHAKELLTSGEIRNYTMEAIATNVGFKSRSVFYQAFKNFTGLTPSQFIESYHTLEPGTN